MTVLIVAFVKLAMHAVGQVADVGDAVIDKVAAKGRAVLDDLDKRFPRQR